MTGVTLPPRPVGKAGGDAITGTPDVDRHVVEFSGQALTLLRRFLEARNSEEREMLAVEVHSDEPGTVRHAEIPQTPVVVRP
jgi:hypothetical protein